MIFIKSGYAQTEYKKTEKDEEIVALETGNVLEDACSTERDRLRRAELLAVEEFTPWLDAVTLTLKPITNFNV